MRRCDFFNINIYKLVISNNNFKILIISCNSMLLIEKVFSKMLITFSKIAFAFLLIFFESRSSFGKDRSKGPSALFFEEFFSFSKSNDLFRRKIYVRVDRHRLFKNHVFENVILIESIKNVILYY